MKKLFGSSSSPATGRGGGGGGTAAGGGCKQQLDINRDSDCGFLHSLLSMEAMIISARSVMEQILQKNTTVAATTAVMGEARHGGGGAIRSSGSSSTRTLYSISDSNKKKIDRRSGNTSSSMIPLSHFDSCAGIVILTCAETGFLITGSTGAGILLQKKKKQNSKNNNASTPSSSSSWSWSCPVACGLTGVHLGFQAGSTLKDVVIFLEDQESVDAILTGKSRLGLSVRSNLTIGKGREIQIGELIHHNRNNTNPITNDRDFQRFDVDISTRKKNGHGRGGGGGGCGEDAGSGVSRIMKVSSATVFCFTEGAFVGISFGGGALVPRKRTNETFYGKLGVKPKDIVEGSVPFPKKYGGGGGGGGVDSSAATNNNTLRSFQELLKLLDEAIVRSRSSSLTIKTTKDRLHNLPSSTQTLTKTVPMVSPSSVDNDHRHTHHESKRHVKEKSSDFGRSDNNHPAYVSGHRNNAVDDAVHSGIERRSPTPSGRTNLPNDVNRTTSRKPHDLTNRTSHRPIQTTRLAVKSNPMAARGIAPPSPSLLAAADRQSPIFPTGPSQQQQHRPPVLVRDPNSSLFVNVDWHAYEKEQYL